MEWTRIDTIELDNKDIYNMRIVLRDETGWILESMPVNEQTAEPMLKKITEKWLKECINESKERKKTC
jgi:hypothetical protein